MKNKLITLTLVIPAYNEERYLKACLNSVARQNVMPSEVIVVDNNSSDKTASIAQKYPFAKVLKEARQGKVFARNRGYEAAKSDLIGRIDADTVLSRDWVEIAVDYFSSHADTAAITGRTRFYDVHFQKIFLPLHTLIYFSLHKKIAGTEILWGSNMVITNSAWRGVRSICNETDDVHEDIDLSICLSSQNKKIVKLERLQAEVSLRRGDLSFSSTKQYLLLWPEVYFRRRLYIRGLLIYTLVLSILLMGLPLFLWHFLFHKSTV